MKPEALLQRGLRDMNIALSDEAVEKLLAFLELLARWNRIHNLTAVREPAQMVPRHILDSLAVLPYLRGPQVLDVGAGAGLPGLPLAVARPAMQFVLLDSNAKKTRFVRQAIRNLGLQNVEAIQERVEKFHPEKKFDTLIARAFAAIPDMLASCGHACADQGRILAMKGAYPREELAAIPENYKVSDIKVLHVPGLDAARHVVIIAPARTAAPE